MKFDKLMGSLHTFELGISEKSKKKKSTTVVSNIEDFEDKCDLDTDEGVSNAIVLLGRQLNKVMKKMDRKTRSNVNNKSLDINKSQEFGRRPKTEEKTNQGKGIQCYGC